MVYLNIVSPQQGAVIGLVDSYIVCRWMDVMVVLPNVSYASLKAGTSLVLCNAVLSSECIFSILLVRCPVFEGIWRRTHKNCKSGCRGSGKVDLH